MLSLIFLPIFTISISLLGSHITRGDIHVSEVRGEEVATTCGDVRANRGSGVTICGGILMS